MSVILRSTDDEPFDVEIGDAPNPEGAVFKAVPHKIKMTSGMLVWFGCKKQMFNLKKKKAVLSCLICLLQNANILTACSLYIHRRSRRGKNPVLPTRLEELRDTAACVLGWRQVHALHALGGR